MIEFILEWMPENKILIVIISIFLNVIISISGFLPSAFLTAVNITVFDFKMGLVLSIVGEAIGAIISFILYRKGINKLSNHVHKNNKWLIKLQHTKGLEAIILVLILRILPFVPSGIVTLVASYSKMNVYAFGLASSLGKVPSLFMEAYAVDRAMKLSTEWQLFLLIILLIIIAYQVLKKRKKQ
jgi:uncharacterized membrane protein YdjX (TVP38/TMEM64 family)